jgi:hypothetical protein
MTTNMANKKELDLILERRLTADGQEETYQRLLKNHGKEVAENYRLFCLGLLKTSLQTVQKNVTLACQKLDHRTAVVETPYGPFKINVTRIRPIVAIAICGNTLHLGMGSGNCDAILAARQKAKRADQTISVIEIYNAVDIDAQH